MSQSAPAVVLLFDDVELGGHLRDALRDGGARIVHEGGVETLSRALLERVGADVLVFNLDDSADLADDALERLYDVVEGDTPRVVFNDAQASRALTGWDRARWARHLAVKVLAMGDLDPPRPAPAEGVGAAAHAVTEADIPAQPDATLAAGQASVSQAGEHTASHPANEASDIDASPAASETDTLALDEDATPDRDSLRDESAGEASEDLSAELEALLAAGDLSASEDIPSGPGLRFADGEEPPPLHDGLFGPLADAEPAHDVELAQEPQAAASENETHRQPATPPVFEQDALELAPLDDVAAAPLDAAPPAAPADASAAPRLSDSWSLLDDESASAPPSAAYETAQAADFGIDKISAADFLAPDAEPMGADDEATMSLQLQSAEEAVAPKAFEAGDQGRASGLTRIVLLGAAADGGASVHDFLSALPSTSRLAFVLTQHLGATPVDELVDALAGSSAVPVRAATHGGLARAGEVIVVPAGQQLLLIRDGSMELMPGSVHASPGPSIDATFSMAANVFGRDALAIVFAGRGTDAVAGAQAVHDRGGEVWVEVSAGEHAPDMVSGISAERLVGFSGTPHALAAHLLEVFA